MAPQEFLSKRQTLHLAERLKGHVGCHCTMSLISSTYPSLCARHTDALLVLDLEEPFVNYFLASSHENLHLHSNLNSRAPQQSSRGLSGHLTQSAPAALQHRAGTFSITALPLRILLESPSRLDLGFSCLSFIHAGTTHANHCTWLCWHLEPHS